MSRRIGIKQDSVLYKGLVFLHREGKTYLYHESGPYQMYGTAAQVASTETNRARKNAYRNAIDLDTVPDVYEYKVVKGRMIWFEEEK